MNNQMQHVLWISYGLQSSVAFTIGSFYAVIKAKGVEHKLTVEIAEPNFTLNQFKNLLATRWNEQWQDDVDPPQLKVYHDKHGILLITNKIT